MFRRLNVSEISTYHLCLVSHTRAPNVLRDMRKVKVRVAPSADEVAEMATRGENICKVVCAVFRLGKIHTSDHGVADAPWLGFGILVEGGMTRFGVFLVK